LALAHGDPKTPVGEKGEPKILATAALELPWVLATGQQRSFPWPVTLDRNGAITEKLQTLLFIFGRTSGVPSRLPLTVRPHGYLKTVVELLESSFQFVAKGKHFEDGWVETKFKPPAARRFSLVNELLLGFRFDGDQVVLRFKFGVKKLDTSGNSMKVKKGVTEIEKRIAEREITRFGAVDHARVEGLIEEAVREVATEL
jgi:hypothetical protein